ncbi:mandelate racemase/muconate lactonizing enzyme family protein [Pseudolysinimonas sp.]|uniref:mandelate racemase/muconate lactonizing enzyme family protein n=1 Tax=Pseudolysinimonas sp. TaxID=2680009 RepID=UPI003F7EAABE
MSVVTEVVTHRVESPLLRPFVTAVRRSDTLSSVLVEVRDDAGRSGWGEAPTSWRVTGESPAGVVAAVEGALAPAVTGLPTHDPDEASRALAAAIVGNHAARMAVDCAMFDLAARTAGRTLHGFLGAGTGSVRTDVTLSLPSGRDAWDGLLADATARVAQGFDVLKVKAGPAADLLPLLLLLRDAVGPHVALRVDANQAWDPDEAIAVIRAVEEAGVDLELVEQPVARDDLAGLVRVADAVDVPVLADESVWTRRQLRELLALGRVDLVNVKLAKSGGLGEARALVEAAHAEGVGVIVGCMLESHVGIAAAAALAATVGGGTHDLDGGTWLARSPVEGGAQYDGATIVLPDAPGTGITGIVGAGA